jgi:Concanavalin A-like lectin/glucanases superfamily
MARSFNGSSDFISLGTTSSISAASMSISTWIYLNAYPSVGQQAAGIITNTNVNFQSFINSSGMVAFGGQGFVLTGNTVLNTGQWYQVVMLISAANTADYINGVFDKSSSGGLAGGTNSQPCDIGQDPQTAGRFLNGYLADVAVWHSLLGTGQITALSQGFRPNTIGSAPIAWWPLDGLQSPEPDLSGNAFNGTLTGTAKVFGPPLAPFTPRWPLFFALSIPPPSFTLMPQAIL